ncbi:MAG TPA: hypothetical protein VN840_19380 [Streptosporangiaceae bacterium]|nr:hypothetical protein [Streptosporangiaceae bacterium]
MTANIRSVQPLAGEIEDRPVSLAQPLPDRHHLASGPPRAQHRPGGRFVGGVEKARRMTPSQLASPRCPNPNVAASASENGPRGVIVNVRAGMYPPAVDACEHAPSQV